MAGFNGGDLISGLLWGTIGGVIVSLLTGTLMKGLFSAFPDVKEKVVRDLPPQSRQKLQEGGYI